MKATDLHLFELLEVQPERGSIQFNKNRRMLVWDADAFGNLRRELIESLGVARSRPILKRFGFANGYRDALTTGEMFEWDDDAEFSSALMGEEVLVVETECAAMGGTHCRVVGKTRRAWGEAGDAYAADYTAQPLSEELEAREAELRRQRRALRRRERELAKLRGGELPSRGGIICKSRAMEDVLDLAQTVARVESNVLITGESGVGKERVARFIHDESPRAEGPFLAVNCGALPETLLESELFGHARGSFTGAETDKEGLFEAARGGTLFLDEIGETSQATQVKLLRVLQEREVLPVSATRPRPIDVRVLAATNRDLDEMVESGAMRKDLYYRLKVVAIEVPPLRDRPEDRTASSARSSSPPARRRSSARTYPRRSGASRTRPPTCTMTASSRWQTWRSATC